MTRRSCIPFSLLILGICWLCAPTFAQEFVIPEGVPPEQRAKMMAQMKAAQKGRPPGAKPATPPKKGGDAKKPDDKKKGDEKKEEKKGSGNVTRPDKPKKPADPKELEAMPTDGKLRLNFRGHPWTAIIEWYSRASGREIEWRELPGKTINIQTQRPYTMDETRDLINRLLLARGFTILDDGEFLMVEKTEGINTALVPRVRPKQLISMAPHSFVRTSFRLTRAKAEELVKELEVMKSKNGKLTAMASSNRIEAMDSARNLLDIFQAIDEEENSGRYAPREFKIKHARAAVVKEKLEEMLGLKQQSAPMTPQQMQQLAQMRQRQAQQNKGQPQQPKKEEKISIVVNDVNNSIIVKAPPSRMMDIEETIAYLDIERGRGGLDSYVDRVKTYRFATLNPEEVKNILMDTAGLDPSTTIHVDEKSKSIIVDAPPWDHMVIQKLAKKLDGSARQFKVVQLRRLSALQVATTVEAMMGEPEDDSKNNNRYGYFYSYRYGNQNKDDKKDKFTVGADVENNRLLLKCNEQEYEVVMDLLTQLGEIHRGGRVENQVVLEVPDEDQDAFLRRVQEAFKTYAPNPIILPPEQPKEEPVKKDEEEDGEGKVDPAVEARKALDAKVTKAATQTIFVQAPSQPATTQLAAEGRSSSDQPAPIVIERNSQGQIVMRSRDGAALEVFEELMRRMAPKKQDWVFFKLKYVTALWMKYQLEDFFKEEEENPNVGRYIYFYEDYGRDKDKKAPGLGDQPTLRFIDDGESTLVVRNASASQLATIQRLIDLYDVREPPNEQNARFRQMIHIKHSKARVIETALKEAFRDLLSNKDKVFDEQNKGGEKEGGGSRRGGFFGSWGDDEPSTGLGTSTFKGKISFGVDESTNILIVTTEGKQLMEIIVEMVKELDQAAVPSDDTRVVTMPAHLNSSSLRETLTKMFGPDAVTEKPNKNGQDPNQQQNQEGQPPKEGGRGNGGQQK